MTRTDIVASLAVLLALAPAVPAAPVASTAPTAIGRDRAPTPDPASGPSHDPTRVRDLAQESPAGAEALVRAELAADAAAVAPGSTFHLVVTLTIEPHWHVYWKNPGDSGGATAFTVRSPEGFVSAAPRFPVPSAFTDEYGTTFGYERDVAFFIPVQAPEVVPRGGTARFEVDVNYLVCRSACLMGETRVSVTVPVGAAEPHAPDVLARIERQRKRLPRPLASVDGIEVVVTKDRVEITGPALGPGDLVLYPDPTPGVQLGAPTVRRAARGFGITMPYAVQAQNTRGVAPHVAGVLAFGADRDAPALEFRIPTAPSVEDSRPGEDGTP